MMIKLNPAGHIKQNHVTKSQNPKGVNPAWMSGPSQWWIDRYIAVHKFQI